MGATVQTEETLQQIRAQRSSESNFTALLRLLDEALATSVQAGDEGLTTALREVKEKQAAAYEKAQETGSTAWPEFEKFVSQFERALLNAGKADT